MARLSFPLADNRTIASRFARCLLFRYALLASMTRIGTRVGLSLGFVLAALVPLSAMADDRSIIIQADSLKWTAAPPFLMKGAQMAVLFGDPAKPGPFAIRMKFPAGYKVPPHTHPTDENLTVLSGTIHVGMGDKLDQTKGESVKTGGFFQMPKGMHHYVWFTQDTD